MKKLVFFIAILILSACSEKHNFTNLKLYSTWHEENIKTPIEKKSFNEKSLKDVEIEKDEKVKLNLLKEFKITVDNLNSSVEVYKIEKLKNEKYLEFTFEGTKYEIILETIEELIEQNKNKTPETKRNSPLIYVKKYNGDESKIYKLEHNDIKGLSIFRMAMFLENEMKK